MWYDALSALLAEIKTCMGGQECPYNMFVSRGIPPADCNSITAFMDRSQPENAQFDGCTNRYNDVIALSITKCCHPAEIDFDPAWEDAEAKCFLDDAELLLDCLHCNAKTALDPWIVGCNPVVLGMEFDDAVIGDCYTATVRIEIPRDVCC